MTTTITLDIDEAYATPEFLVSVLQQFQTHGRPTEYSVCVLFRGPDGVYREVEEVGEGPLREIMIDAARVIRTGTAVKR